MTNKFPTLKAGLWDIEPTQPPKTEIARTVRLIAMEAVRACVAADLVDQVYQDWPQPNPQDFNRPQVMWDDPGGKLKTWKESEEGKAYAKAQKEASDVEEVIYRNHERLCAATLLAVLPEIGKALSQLAAGKKLERVRAPRRGLRRRGRRW